jgi:3-dehydrosphinganine reductase
MGGLELEGQVVVITGGSSGLGKALACRLAARGARLALVARDMAKLERAREEILGAGGHGREVLTFSCDVSDYAAVEKTFSGIAERLGPPRLLVNSAGILREGYFERVPLDTFHSVMDINYYGTLHCIKAVLPWFEKQGGGWIVNICSIGGRHGGFGYTAYSSSKFAVMGLTESLRGELKPRGIRVQVACPAEFESPMVEELNKDRTPENRQVVHTFPVLNAEGVADAVVRGMERKRYMIIPDWRVRWLDWSANALPFISRVITDTQVRLARRMKGIR